MAQTLEQWGDSLRVILEGQLNSGSIFAFVIVFAAGVLTSFTPCVYPMIPVTVTYIGSAAHGSRRDEGHSVLLERFAVHAPHGDHVARCGQQILEFLHACHLTPLSPLRV